MKIVLFSPTIKTSAIGRVASLVTRELADQGHDVSVVRTEIPFLMNEITHDFGVELISWNSSRRIHKLCSQGDLFIYHIGNSYDFHSGCIEWLARYPGVVCLHDFFLGHLFSEWSRTDPALARTILRTWYGEEMSRRYFAFSDSDAFIEGTREAAPLTEWICSMAQGVISHSRWGIERVMRSCPGPVRVVPLAYSAPTLGSGDDLSDVQHSKFNILTVGHVNPNKRVAQVINAIGSSQFLRQNSVYRVVGKIESQIAEELLSLAAGKEVNLIVSGEVDDAQLTRAIIAADVVSCVRWPNLEAASASAIEAMLYGKAIIVVDTGFFEEVPGSVVKKIDLSNEIFNIKSALEELALNSKEREGLGARAAVWARATFSVQNYAEQVVQFGGSVSKARPKIATVNHFVQLMERWSASHSIMTLDDTINPLAIFSDNKEF